MERILLLLGLVAGATVASHLLDRPLESYSKYELLGKLEALHSQCAVKRPGFPFISNDATCCPAGQVAMCLKCELTSCGANADCFVIDEQIVCACRFGYTGNAYTGCRNSSEATGAGDPHYKTLDGTYYDYQGTCPYVYSKPCKLNGLSSYYVVKAKNKLFYPNSPVSYVSDVEVSMHGQKFRIDEGMNLYVNDIREFFPFYYPSKAEKKVSVELRGAYAYIVNSDAVQVTFAKAYISLKLPQLDEFLGKDGLCGFAGNLNNNCTDDLIDANGNGLIQANCHYPRDQASLKKIAVILDTWRTNEFGGWNPVGSACESGDTINPKLPPCDTTQSARDCLPIKQAIDGQGPFAACKVLGAQRIESAYDSCAFDGCHIKGSKCQAFTDFVGQCQQAIGNANLEDWRGVVGCPLDCARSNPFSTYSACMSGCQPSCQNQEVPVRCDKGCNEGCKCVADYVLDTTLNPPKCVKAEQCPCVDPQGNSHPQGFSWLSDKCSKVNVCFSGRIHVREYACPVNSSCGNEGGNVACICNPGFKWDVNKTQCIR